MFELLLLALLPLSLAALGWALALTRRRRAAARALGVLGLGWAGYLAVVAAVAALQPRQVLGMNQELCFDEMCFAAVGVRLFTAPPDAGAAPQRYLAVTIRIHSRSRGRAQSEGGLHARLWDGRGYRGESALGRRAYAAANGAVPPLTARLQPGDSALAVALFDAPASAAPLGLVLDHGLTPGFLVIGESPWFHGPALIRLEAPAAAP